MTTLSEVMQNVSGTLNIELSMPRKTIGNSYNEKADPSSKIKSLKFDAEYLHYDEEDPRAFTDEELDRFVYDRHEIIIRSAHCPGEKTHSAPNGVSFRLRDILKAIESTERSLRPMSEWFGGIDIHHVYFEGLEPDGEGRFLSYWGS